MSAEGELLTRLARSSGLSRQEVLRFAQLDLAVVPDGPLEPRLVRRLRRAHRLRRDLGLSVDAVVIVLRLLDCVEERDRRQDSELKHEVTENTETHEANK